MDLVKNSIRMTLTYLMLEHLLKSLHMHLLLENCLCSKDCTRIHNYIGDPLVWCYINEGQFPNKCCIPSQTNSWHSLVTHEIEIVFSLAGVLTSFQSCHLQVKNLDQIITMVKDWFNDPCFNCKKKVDMKKY